MRQLLLCIAFLSGCELYFDDDPAQPPTGEEPTPEDPKPHQMTMVLVDSMAGERVVTGVDSDGAGGVWILYRDPTAHYYDLADVRVVHLDSLGHKQSEWLYQDEYTPTAGIAYTGDALWVNYTGAHDHLRKLDPVTGATLGTFATEYQIVDIAAGAPGQLLLSSMQNQIITIDRATGGQISRVAVAASFIKSTQRGITFVNGQPWIASWLTDDIYVIDANGATTDYGSTTVRPDHTAAENIYLAWDGSAMIMAARNQLFWFAVSP